MRKNWCLKKFSEEESFCLAKIASRQTAEKKDQGRPFCQVGPAEHQNQKNLEENQPKSNREKGTIAAAQNHWNGSPGPLSEKRKTKISCRGLLKEDMIVQFNLE